MSEPSQEAVSIISSVFEIKSQIRTIDMIQFEIDDEQFKSKFVKVAQKLEARSMLARLERVDGKMFILVNNLPPPKHRRVWIPKVLFVVVIIFTMIDGYFRTESTNSFINIGNPFEMAVLYTVSLIGILGVHESGHLIAAKIHKIKTTWPYFIPGIPVFGIPTFGALIMSRGLTVNRDILFDIAIAGPIAGLVVAIAVSIFGAYISPTITGVEAQELFGSSQLLKINENIIMTATLAMFGKTGEGVQVLMTPILFAAWLGFLITFLNLLPAWQLDGGHMARAILGRKWHRIATYASIGLLALLGYTIMAVFILMFSIRSPDVKPLDDISPLSENRKKLFLVVILLAILCAPLPFSILP